MWKLVVRYGEAGEADFPLRDELTIGRAADNGLVLDDASVSRRHARAFCEGGAPLIEDCGSANGVFCNGERIAGRRELRAGDALLIGGHKLIVLWSADELPPAADDTANRTFRATAPSYRPEPTASPPPPGRAPRTAAARPTKTGCLGVLTLLAFGAIVCLALC